MSRVCVLLYGVVMCRRQNGQEGFVPANYVKEVEPLKTTKTAKKKEMVSVPVKVSIMTNTQEPKTILLLG